jgi:hypothetical protein
MWNSPLFRGCSRPHCTYGTQEIRAGLDDRKIRGCAWISICNLIIITLNSFIRIRCCCWNKKDKSVLPVERFTMSDYSDFEDSDRSMENGFDSECASEDKAAFCSDDDSSYGRRDTTSYMFLITLVEVDGKEIETSRLVGTYTTKEKAIKAARRTIKRRSGYYPSTGKCDEPSVKDHTANYAGENGELYEESNRYGETKTIRIAKVVVNEDCHLIIGDR